MRKLSIAIPTYHRPAELARLIEIISSEITEHNLEHLVEVLVRDNSIDQSTSVMMSSPKYSTLSWLDYKRNETNIGFDLNVLNLYHEAQGDYVWLVGDDDLIFAGSISRVLELLPLEADIIHLPFRQPEGLKKPQYQLTPRVKEWTLTTGAVEQILKYIKITSFVYRRRDIQIQKSVLEHQFSYSGWMHLALGLEILSSSKQIKTITLSDFFAGSIDKEWQTINWTPAAFLLGEKLYQHRIFNNKEARGPIKQFANNMYLSGISLTLEIASGVLGSSLPLKEYTDFGAKYPFRRYLWVKPLWLMKYIILKLNLSNSFRFLFETEKRVKKWLKKS